jgi:hypothetical protein
MEKKVMLKMVSIGVVLTIMAFSAGCGGGNPATVSAGVPGTKFNSDLNRPWGR